MDEKWHNISYGGDTSSGAVWAEACAEEGSPWFSGHFPNEPILPGIAILSMVTDVIRHYESEKGKKIRMAAIKRVRFRLPVRPGETLAISPSLPREGEELTYNFKVTAGGKTVCTGIVVFEPLP